VRELRIVNAAFPCNVGLKRKSWSRYQTVCFDFGSADESTRGRVAASHVPD
jgi:hypothetical protein